MALDKQGSSATKRRPSLRGSLLSYVSKGTEVQARWPRKRGPSKTQKEQDRKNFFTAVQFAYRWLEPNMKIQLREAVAGTPLLPRDLWLSIAAGNFGSIGLLSGKVMYSMADMKKVSASIDALAQDEGDLLVRGNDFWEALAPGTAGQLLTAHGAGIKPTWVDPPVPPPPPVSGDLRLITSFTLASPLSSIVLTPTGGPFSDILIVLSGQTDIGAPNMDIHCRFNASAAPNYSTEMIFMTGSTNSSFGQVTQTSAFVGWLQSFNNIPNECSTIRLTINNYRKSGKYKDWLSEGGFKNSNNAFAMFRYAGWGDFQDTAPINDMTLFPASGQFNSGLSVRMYGIV